MGQPWYTSGDASGGFDTTDLEKLIASLSRAQAPTDEDRSAARSQALQVAGLSLLGTPKGQVWGRAGQAGMNALAARQQYLSDIPKQRQAAIESAGKAMTLQEQLEALKERKQYEAGLRGGLLQAPGAEPTAGPTPISPSMAQAFAAPPLPPSVSGVLNNPGGALPGLPPVSQLSQAPAVSPSSIESPSAPAPAATGTDPYSVLMKQAMQAQNVYQTTGNRYAQKQAEHFFGMAEKWREKMGEPKVGMVGGKPTLVRYGDYGGQQNVAGVEPTPEFATVDRGGSTDFVNKYTIPSTGQSFTKSMTPGEIAADARAKAQLAQAERHFQADHELSDPTKVADMAKGIASYQLPPLQSWALSKPQGQAIMGEVMRLNPAYAAQDYATSQKALNAFATGKQGQAVNSFNVALAHLDTLQDAAKALKTGDSQALNKASNFFKQQTGNPAPTNFEGIKQIVGAEIVKAITNGGGGVEDRKTAAEAISKAGSPAQLQGIIDKYKELMVGQLHGLRQQYEQTTKRKDFHTKLSPQALKLLGEGQQQEDDIAAAMRIVTGGKP